MAILRTDVTMVPTGEGSSGGKPLTSFLFTEDLHARTVGCPEFSSSLGGVGIGGACWLTG
nr:hypothetical protein Iba_scaffold59164CG0010 [Ipomoea batatas]